MNRKQVIQDIARSQDIDEMHRVQLNNLDWAELVNTKDGMKVLNEHGTTFELCDLSDTELETFAFELDIPPRFDYVILDESNHWISTGFQQTQEQIDQEVEELVSNTDLEIFVFQAKELTRTNFQGALKSLSQ